MYISCLLLLFVRLAFCEEGESDAAWPSIFDIHTNVKHGSARQFLGSSFIRDNVAFQQQQQHHHQQQQQQQMRSGGNANAKNKKQHSQQPVQKQQFNDQHHFEDEDLLPHPSDYPPPELEHEGSSEVDYFGQDLPHYVHEIYTTEPMHPHQSVLNSGGSHGSELPRANLREVGARSRGRGGRTDLYKVSESGDRREFSRGREGYINMMHTKGKVFRPHVSLVEEEAQLAIPKDAHGHECRNTCDEMQWQCKQSCICISKAEVCDKENQCADGSDEVNCEEVGNVMSELLKNCEQTNKHVMCPKTFRCINKEWLCDGDDDCGDYSDETNCGIRINCTEDMFTCQNGFCIPRQWVCDGENDCKDYSDEMHCNRTSCSEEHFTCNDGYCISMAFRCDGERDCNDNSDEMKCPAVINSCPEGEFKCRGGLGGAGGPSGQCILNRFRCDGDNDCGDWSDEENCPQKPMQCTSSEFKCADGTCIPKRWKCDKEHDCDGGEDENDCGTMNPAHPTTCGTDEFTCNNGRCILRTWLCDGYPDCSSSEDEVDCPLQCDAGQFLCPAKKNITNLKICVHQKHVCDGQQDCPLGDDELNCPKPRNCTDSRCEQLCITTARGKDECACRLGFLMHPNGRNCTDIDECQYLTNPVCSQNCHNTRGSFNCSCEPGYVLRPDLRSCKALGGAMTLIVANRWDIRRVTLSNNRYTAIVKGLHNAIALDFHYRKGIVFWSDVSTDVIKMVYINGTRVRDVIKWGLESPGGIAVDWIHDLLFWTDSGTRRVEVSNFQGNLRAVVAANDLDKPRAIVIHPGEAFVFWSDWGPNPKIERASMDGSNRRIVINKGVTWPNGLAIDYPNNKLYWADAKQHAIESANLDGSERVKILSTHLPHPFALTIFEDTMYWTDWNTKTIGAANKITGKGFRSVHENFHFPMDIHAYHPARQPDYPDRCQKDRRGLRGGCSHLCLPNKNSRRCGCPIGLALKEDGKTCKSAPEKLVLVARRKDIRLRTLHSKFSAPSDIDMIVPLDNLKYAIAIDWCSDSDYIYWTDAERSSINRAHLNGSYQQKVIHTNLVFPTGLALDWVTDKLYWADQGTKRIEVSTTNGVLRTLLIWENLDKPRDIVVNPIDAFMFWSDWGEPALIERAYLDGQHRQVILSKNLKFPNGLAIDYDQQKLYFVDGGIKTLESVNFDGSSRKTILNGLRHPFGLDVSENTVYWTEWESNSAMSANKFTGHNMTTIISNTSDLMDIRVFHRSRKRIHNACAISNGGCSHLCLLSKTNVTCACPVGVKLLSDQRTCANGPSHYILFAHRVDIRQISLDFDHMIDVVLPLPPISNAVALDVDRQTGFIYWSDTVDDVIMSSSPDGLHVHKIIGEGLDNADGLVIDSIGRMIYWADAGRHTVEVATLEGEHRHLIASRDLESPRGLALDYEAGFLFWTDWGHYRKIERAYMDGDNRQRIVTSNLGWPNGLSLDLKAKRIYWVDAQLKTIDSCDYTGNQRKLIMSSLYHPYALTLTDDSIYWTDWKSKALHMADRLNISAKRDIMTKIDGLMDIKAITTNKTLPENVCGKNNGGCSHLCLRNPTGYSCQCPIGIKLRNDSKTQCHTLPEHDFLLIALRSGIGMISLNTPEYMDVALPITGVHGAVVLDFHVHKGFIFFADVNLDVIRRINMLNFTDTKVIVNTNLLTPNGIAVDWIADNLYWSDTDRKVIEVARLDGSSRKQLIVDDLGDPRSLIVHPKKGYLFWSDWEAPARIERSFLDGSNRSIIITNNLGFPTGLAIDFENRRLMWADALDDNIGVADFNGTRRTNIIQLAPHPFGLTMFNTNIYWTDWYNKSVYRAGRTPRGFTNPILIREGLSGALDIRVVSKKRQQIDWNQCSQDNGGCSHLCLYRGSDYICACPDRDDDRECSYSPRYLVPKRTDDPVPDYTDDVTESNASQNERQDDEYEKKTSKRETFVLVASGIVTVMLIIIIIAILFLMFNSKRNKTKRTSRGSSRSVITFSNPNYNVDGAPMEPKTNIWKRFKYDKSHERVYEERSLTTETASSSLFVPTPSPMHSPSNKHMQLTTLSTIT